MIIRRQNRILPPVLPNDGLFDYDPTIPDVEHAPQELTLPKGKYEVELWGARGGVDLARGGYTRGILELPKETKLWLYIGGAGALEKSDRGHFTGGWNGGGCGVTVHPGSAEYGAASGGGATDIRLAYGQWKLTIFAAYYGPATGYWTTDDIESLRSRIMVAAGGGTNLEAWAGGLVGGTAKDRLGIHSYPGTQTGGGVGSAYPGSFGLGGCPRSLYYGRGAGAGYYGGGAGGELQYYGSGSGSGGSSFISGHEGCDAVTEEGIHTGQPNHYSGLVFTDTVMKAGNEEMPNPRGEGIVMGNNGAGFARIKKVG